MDQMHPLTGLGVSLTVAVLLTGCLAPSEAVTHAPENLLFRLEPVAENLSFPVSIAWTPDGRLFFTERFTGNVRVIENGSLRAAPFAHENVTVRGEGGILGLAVHPDFAEEPWLYVSFTKEGRFNMDTQVVRYRADAAAPTAREVVVANLPADRYHAGGILEFGPDGMLYVSGGDAGLEAAVPWACLPHGKIHRFTPEGDLPGDAPYPCRATWSSGHRNVFGLAFHPETGDLYATENGPEKGDEVNLVRPRGNYGWPLVLGPSGRVPFFDDPLLTYTPPIAPTEATFYQGDAYGPESDGALFFGAWVEASLHRVVLDAQNGTVVKDEVVFNGTPILDVEVGPDGDLYVATATSIARVVPRAS